MRYVMQPMKHGIMELNRRKLSKAIKKAKVDRDDYFRAIIFIGYLEMG